MEPAIRDKIDEFIKARGLRRTEQREVIIQAAFSTTDHYTAEQLWERARQIDPNTSRATVYRTISLLVDANLLREIDLGGDQKHYDPNFIDHPTHNHLICIDCGKVIEFEDEHIDVLEDCITRRMGFRPSSKSIRIEACCEKLRSTGMCDHLLEMRLGKNK